ncbi:hypothetical protein EV175_000965 [Coemansia sp. RSA 1933]|nr:hypothetical protein EV175_000965 [Coemansia sp. RSA 1933]
MRSLWSKETAASPLNTPTGQRLRLSPAVIHKRSPPPSGFKGLVFRLDAAEPSSTDPGQLGLLGSVEEALVTDADLEASRRKLGEEYALTQQQIIREVRDRVMAFACSSEVGLRLAEWRESVSILCQFYTLGHGRLAFTKQGIVWCGYMLGPISAVSQSSDSSIASNDYEAAANTTLLFPWTRVTSLRRKDIDDSCFVMATVDHDLGVAFNMGDHQSHEPASDIGAMVAKMNELLSDVLRNESASQQTPELASQSVDRGHLESYHMDQRKGRDVILYALELAKSHDKRFVDLDVPGILHSEDFMASSMSSVLEFSLILAKKASAVMEHDPVTIDDDPETESAPGTCTLCYAENESVVFQQCDHKVCESCFSHLRAMGSSSSSQPISSARIACICPWDRTEIESWIKI